MNTQFGVKANKIGAVQGDVPFRYIAALPNNTRKRTDNIIARGEATGHHHMVEVVEGNAQLYADDLGNLFIQVNEPVRVLHQEHGYILFTQPGIVQIGLAGALQVEYDGEEERRVRD